MTLLLDVMVVVAVVVTWHAFIPNAVLKLLLINVVLFRIRIKCFLFPAFREFLPLPCRYFRFLHKINGELF
jgi:hypothetical protein